MIRFPNPWAYNQRPPSVNPRVRPRYTVHICVPCYNEPSDIVFATCEAALALRHEWCKVHVYMLDDGRNLEREKKVMMMGNDRFVYLARNKFPGVPIHGKAGNINSALKFNIFAKKPPTENDVVIIFDADMKAHPNFLNHVMPYLEEDPMTALVQTPQHFFNVDHTGDVFNHQNSTFFFGVQTGLDAWRATVCCGTNFAVRAAPLAAVGWFPTESITEDFLLSLKLTASGWHCRYHGHVLTTGEAPEDLRQIFKQRSRWCAAVGARAAVPGSSPRCFSSSRWRPSCGCASCRRSRCSATSIVSWATSRRSSASPSSSSCRWCPCTPRRTR